MRAARVFLTCSSAVLLACAGESGPPPLGITSTTPAALSNSVETGATVAVTFSEAIDPATLTAATFKVKRDGVPLVTSLSYDAATYTATAVVPLLPGVTYEAEVTTGVTTPGGTPPAAALTWTFTTRAWQGTTADTSLGGPFPSLALAADGRFHVSHYDFAGRNLRYATCAAACAAAAGWQMVAVDTAGDRGATGSLAVEPSGRVHVAYYDQTAGDLRYATCPAACALLGNWQTASVDSAGDQGASASLVRDAAGRLHVTYHEATGDDLRYATCGGSCAVPTNWDAVTVDAAGDVGQYTSLAVDGAGRLHVSYYEAVTVDLKYATCAGACTVAANWQTATVDATGDVGFGTALAVHGTRVHVAHWDIGNEDVKYSSCPADCATVANWQSVTVEGAGSVGNNPALAVDGQGRVHATYFDNSTNRLTYATCAAACSAAGSWQVTRPEPAVGGGTFSALVVSGDGRLHVAQSSTTGRLRYVE